MLHINHPTMMRIMTMRTMTATTTMMMMRMTTLTTMMPRKHQLLEQAQMLNKQLMLSKGMNITKIMMLMTAMATIIPRKHQLLEQTQIFKQIAVAVKGKKNVTTRGVTYKDGKCYQSILCFICVKYFMFHLCKVFYISQLLIKYFIFKKYNYFMYVTNNIL